MSRDNFSIPGYDAWKTRAPEDEPGYWDDREPEDDPDVHYNVGWVDAVEAAAKIADDGDPQIAARIRELKTIAENDGAI